MIVLGGVCDGTGFLNDITCISPQSHQSPLKARELFKIGTQGHVCINCLSWENIRLARGNTQQDIVMFYKVMFYKVLYVYFAIQWWKRRSHCVVSITISARINVNSNIKYRKAIFTVFRTSLEKHVPEVSDISGSRKYTQLN